MKNLKKLEQFAELLLYYNRVHKITGLKSFQEIMNNVKDSLYPMKFLDIKNICKALDVGTGAGFPGLAIAIEYSQFSYTLCEPIIKKSAFLNLCKVELSLDNVNIKSTRVETLNKKFDFITSRAVCSTKDFLKLTTSVRDAKTTVVLYKGSSVESELDGILHKKYHFGNRNYIILGS